MPETTNPLETLYEQACQALAAGEAEAAEALLHELLAQPRKAPAGRFLPDLDSFLSQVALGRYEQQDWSLDWHDLAGMLLSQLEWDLGKPEDALRRLQSLLESRPSAEGYHLLGRWLLQLDQRMAAIGALNQALQQDPAYLPAYEDLVMLANLNGDSDLAFGLIQQAIEYELTPRLFQELLLACSRQDFVPARGLFLELCVRSLTPASRPLLIPLLQQLYAEGDFHNAAYLGAHLLQAFPNEREVLSLYVLAALHLQQYAPALQALLQAPESFFRQGEHWYKLGVAYSLWKMPDFARHAFSKAKALNPALEPEIAPWRKQDGPPELDALLGQLLRQMLLQPAFGPRLRQDPQSVLAEWSLPASADLLAAIEKLPQPEAHEEV